VADSEKGVPRALPGEEPWEFDWPDDAKEVRQAERDAARKQAETKPAPRFFTAYLLGVWTVLAFVLLITAVGQITVLFFRLVSPIALIGLIAFVLGYVLNLLTERLNAGIANLVFMFVGGFIGYFWSYMIVTWLFERDFGSFDEASSSDRMAIAVLFLTATATAFVLARAQTDNVRKSPKTVYIAAATLLALAIPSTVLWVQDLVAYF
jgi:hypothetical protein